MRGKFLFVGSDKLFVRGVTYGTFRPDADGLDYPSPEIVTRDFEQMAAAGITAVRLYTVPPRWLLDLARQHGLRVMVGLPWEQHVAFLDDADRARDIEARVRAGVRACAGHPAVLCYAIGNEIPSSIVRWYGRHRIERFLKRLYDAARQEDPDGLVTYVNYPSTEYLDLPFVDLVLFNVYLEAEETLAAYLARLQNIAGDRPLVMAEIGLDSRRHGEEEQARTLDWQIRTAFKGGCAGAFVFAWTDEWHRGGFDVDDWDFGLTDRQRRPKPALAAVSRAFAETPFPPDLVWPRISVVVCSYNGARTLRDCCEGLLELDYPDYEVIVVDDGSTDQTASIAREYGFSVISTENRGLSSARNTGLAAAAGEIVAYTDDDARPDPHWLRYLALTFLETEYVGVGGPNIAPPGDGPIAECVANAPGGPIHVLLTDREAEHIPGCNMAFRAAALRDVGGFDSRFRTAGDDVDICWQLQARGWKLGFSPAAMVWHHRRNQIRAYWRQQRGYGVAEALLERKWPEKYNSAGHRPWGGRVYGPGLTRSLWRHYGRVYQGVWGLAPFQSVCAPTPSLLGALPLMPEWLLGIAGLAAVATLGLSWRPLLATVPLLLLAVAVPVMQAVLSARRARFPSEPRSRRARFTLQAITALLHLLQPIARLWGRFGQGLTPWRRSGLRGGLVPRPAEWTLWSERWRPPERWLRYVQAALQSRGARAALGGAFDRWDLEARGGLLGAARLRLAIEEHGGGRQLVRFRIWPRPRPRLVVTSLVLAAIAALATLDTAWLAAGVFGVLAVLLLLRGLAECVGAQASLEYALRATGPLREAGPVPGIGRLLRRQSDPVGS